MLEGGSFTPDQVSVLTLTAQSSLPFECLRELTVGCDDNAERVAASWPCSRPHTEETLFCMGIYIYHTNNPRLSEVQESLGEANRERAIEVNNVIVIVCNP